jgi:hypothetical protein
MSSLEKFIKKYGIQILAEKRDSRPDHLMSDVKMDHWLVCLSAKAADGEGRALIKLFYSKGLGHKGVEPELHEVLECLHSDSGAEHGSFEDWASDFGYSTDSRSAERVYLEIQSQTKMLESLLGAKGFDEFKNLDPNTF